MHITYLLLQHDHHLLARKTTNVATFCFAFPWWLKADFKSVSTAILPSFLYFPDSHDILRYASFLGDQKNIFFWSNKNDTWPNRHSVGKSLEKVSCIKNHVSGARQKLERLRDHVLNRSEYLNCRILTWGFWANFLLTFFFQARNVWKSNILTNHLQFLLLYVASKKTRY